MIIIPVKGHVLFKPIKKIIYSQNRIPLRKILLYSFYNIYVLVNHALHTATQLLPSPLPSSKECSQATGYSRLLLRSTQAGETKGMFMG